MAKKKPAKVNVDWTEASVFRALESAYCDADRWVIVPQVPDATSFDKNRTIDAMAFSCWKSVGIAVHGFEIKVSRSDWLRELQSPEKSAGFIRRCNYWWIAAPEGVVKLEELPGSWGLQVVSKTEDGYAVKVKRPATFNADPVFEVSFIVALARSCYRQSPERKASKEQIDEAYAKGRKAALELKFREKPFEIKVLQRENSEMKDRIATFESESGIKLCAWSFGNVGHAVRALEKLGDPKLVCGELVERLEKLLALAKEVAAEPLPPNPEPIRRREAEKQIEQDLASRGVGIFDDEYHQARRAIEEPADDDA